MGEVRCLVRARVPDPWHVPPLRPPASLQAAALPVRAGQHVVALVDCAAFYVSCERLFRPDLAAVPVVVLSNGDGCVIARSREAKALGVAMGAPFFRVRRLLDAHGAHVFSSNYGLYHDLSRRVLAVLRRFSPDVEAYSIDEAFLRLPAAPEADLVALAHAVREAVRRDTGVDTHVGVGPTKTLAKVADELSRAHGGACALSAGDARLHDVPVEDVWGVGRQYGPRLRAAGVETAADLAAVPPAWARRAMTVVGERLVRELRGEPCLPVELLPPLRRSVTRSRSFSRPLRLDAPPAVEPPPTARPALRGSAPAPRGERRTEAPSAATPSPRRPCGTGVASPPGAVSPTPPAIPLGDLGRAVATYAARASEAVRASGLAATTVTVFVTTRSFGPGPHHEAARTVLLPVASADTRVLARTALAVLATVARTGVGYRKAGVVLGGLRPARPAQGHLFAEVGGLADARADALMQAVDALNRRYGAGTLHLAQAAPSMARRDEPWQMRQQHRSPDVLSSWMALPRVQA